MLVTAALVLGLCQIGMALAGEWWEMLLLRCVVGLALPALLVMAIWTGRLRGDQKSRFGRITPRVFRAVMEQPGLPQAYLAMFRRVGERGP